MDFTAIFSYMFITAFTPGPNNIMSMNIAGHVGFKKSLPFCFGVFIGIQFIAFICAFFGNLLFAYIPKIEPVMKWLGVAYILFLAFVVLFEKQENENQKSKITNSVLNGMLMQFINVKAYLYALTTYTTFVLPYEKSIFVLISVSLLLGLFGLVATSCWAAFGSLFQRLFVKYNHIIKLVMFLLLIYCAVSIIIH